jgi:hypothetical protein
MGLYNQIVALKKKNGRGGKREGAGRPATIGTRPVRLTLDDETITKGTKIGDGNLSRGVRIAVKEHESKKRS